MTPARLLFTFSFHIKRYYFTAVFFVLFTNCSGLNPQNSFEIFPDRTVKINGEIQSFHIRKLLQSDETWWFLTWRDGAFKLNSGKLSSVETAEKSPVFTNQPVQVEDIFPESNKIYFVTRNRIFSRENGLLNEIIFPGIRGGTRYSSIIKSSNQLWVGSTFNGIYRLEGTNWRRRSDGLPKEAYSWGEYFWDEISTIFSASNRLYLSTDASGEIFEWVEPSNSWLPLNIRDVRHVVRRNQPEIIKTDGVYHLNFSSNQSSFSRSANLSTSILINPTTENFSLLRNVYPYKRPAADFKGKNVTSLFINLDFIKKEDVDTVLKLLKEKHADSVIINFKDDTGNLIYGSKLTQAAEIGSSMVHPKLASFLEAVKPYKPWVVARLVCFKDYRLWKFQSNRYAVWDSVKKQAFHPNKTDYWVDPFSPFVVEYNLAVAAELEARKSEFGIDEIQFDYIRMPADRESWDAVFRFKPEKWEKYDMMENFLSQATNRLKIPFSLDIFGYNGAYRMGNVYGQDLETISKYADCVSPMNYPSHFGAVYFKARSNSQAYEILKFTTAQAKRIMFEGTVLRPYLQAFPWHAKPAYNADYVFDQVKGAEISGADGVCFWNPGSKYQSLSDFFSISRTNN